MIFSLEFARKTALAYNVICKPLPGAWGDADCI